MRLTAVALAAIALLGCSGSDESTPAPPAAPCVAGEWQREDGGCIPAGLPPDMPCPPGEWQREDGTCIPAGVPPDGCAEGFVHDGDRGCDAILPAAPCAPGLMAVPGEMACREVAPCAAGTWGDIPVESDTEYVDAGYTGMDSDGSALKPWTTIQAAVDAASSGAIVAIAQGSYLEDVRVTGKQVRLWGVCPERVEIVATGAELAALQILAGAAATEVRSLAISGDGVGLATSGSLDLLVERVWVHDTTNRGVVIQNDFGPSSMVVRGSLVEDCAAIGVFAGGALATVEASVVRGTALDAQGLGGRGVSTESHPSTGAPGTIVVRGSLVEQNHEVGVYSAGSMATVEASVIRETQPNAQGMGIGVHGQHDTSFGAPSTLVVRASLVEGNHAGGVVLGASDASIEATVIRDTQLGLEGIAGQGVSVQAHPTTGAPSTCLMRTSLVERSHGASAVFLGSQVTVEASAVRDTQPDAHGLGGSGLSIHANTVDGGPATVTVQTSLVEQSHAYGMFVAGSETTIEASIVRETQLDAALFGRAFQVTPEPMTLRPSIFVLRASLVEQSHEVGVVLGGSEGTIESSVVRDTQTDSAGFLGRGIHAQDYLGGPRATLLLRSALVERSHEFGVVVVDSDATIDSSIIRDTAINGQGLFGDGFVVAAQSTDEASATLRATRIERSVRAAIAAHGAHAAVGDSVLSCQAFDLDSEIFHERAATLEDLGGNYCGCPEATSACAAVSANLAPPGTLDDDPMQ